MSSPVFVRDVAQAEVTTLAKPPTIKCLTSLRFLAAFAIFLHHAADFGLASKSFTQACRLSLGVSFFFVLSGYVLTYTYQRRRLDYWSFCKARFMRLWPAMVFSQIFLLFLVSRSFYLPSGTTAWPEMIMIFGMSLLMLQSLVPIPAVYFAFNAVCWSVSTEFVFYLAFPWLRSGLKRNALVVCVATLCLGLLVAVLSSFLKLPAFSPTALSVPTWHGLIYINPLSRIQEFMLGMIAASLMQKDGVIALISLGKSKIDRSRVGRAISGILEIAALFAIVLIAIVLRATVLGGALFRYAPLHLLVGQWIDALMFAAIIFVLAMQVGWLSRRALGWGVLILLGEISYSMYLIHRPILTIMGNSKYLRELLPGGSILAISFVICTVVSWLMWRLIERPFLSLMRHSPKFIR